MVNRQDEDHGHRTDANAGVAMRWRSIDCACAVACSSDDCQLFCEVKDNNMRLCVDAGERGKISQPRCTEGRESKASAIADRSSLAAFHDGFSDAVEVRNTPLLMAS